MSVTAHVCRGWTGQEEECLEAMRLDGRSLCDIALALGRTVGSVKAMAWRLAAVKVLVAESRWLALLARPHTNRGLADFLGLTADAVKRARSRLRRKGFDVLDSGQEGSA